MELKEAIERRKSIRQYRPDPVPEDVLDGILERARRAPSAGGLRAYRAVVTRARLTRYEAPASVVVCALPERSGERYGDRGRGLYAVQDATIYAAYVQLLATDAGLDTCWVGAFHEYRVKQALGLGEDERPVAVLTVGYAA